MLASGDSRFPRDGRTGAVGAAFVGKITDQGLHRRVMGAADERCCLPLLRNEACVEEPPEMMRKRRGWNVQLLLDAADGQPFFARQDKSPVELQPRRVAKSLELRRCFSNFMEINLCFPNAAVNGTSTILEIPLIGIADLPASRPPPRFRRARSIGRSGSRCGRAAAA